MADYKQQNISGASWQRASRIILENPIGQMPSAHFIEQTAIDLGGKIITQDAGALFAEFDPAASFPLVDENLQPVGQSMTQAALLGAMRSLYIHLAQERDADIAAEMARRAQQ